MSDELLTLLWRSTVGSSLAALAVLAIRPLLRKAFGCGTAYGAWLAVPLVAIAAVVPAPVDPAWTLRVVPATFSVTRVASVPTAASTPWWPTVVLIVWGLGVVAAAARQVRLQRDFVRALGPLTTAGDVAVSASLVAGPSLVGLWKPSIVVPADFEQRYTSQERELVVAHERAHARHGDPFVNAVCAALRCLWWFNPIVHWADRAVRTDQELARDADVMRAYPQCRRAYASALLKAQLVTIDAPMSCHWQSRHPLQERMMILTRTAPVLARRLGAIVVSLAMLGGTYATWAAQGAPDVDPGRAEHARWANARPATVVKVEGDPQSMKFMVSAVVRDLATGAVLAKPRLLTAAGIPATIEIGSDQVAIRLVVTIDPSGRDAAYTSEVLREGRVASAQSGTLAIARADVSAVPAPSAATAGAAVGPALFNLSFSSSDAKELACAADVFAARGDAGLAGAMRVPADGRVHVASLTTQVAANDRASDALVAALARCQLGVDSNLAYSMRPEIEPQR